MANTLQGKRIAILATDGFEQSELIKPRQALDEAGARTQVVSPKEDKIKGWDMKDWGKDVPVDVPLKSATHPNTTGCCSQAGFKIRISCG